MLGFEYLGGLKGWMCVFLFFWGRGSICCLRFYICRSIWTIFWRYFVVPAARSKIEKDLNENDPA